MACSLKGADLRSRSVLESIQLKLKGSLCLVNGIVVGSRPLEDEEGVAYVILFDPKTNPQQKDKIRGYIQWALLTYAFTVVNAPAISVPCGFTGNGLPVGLQIAGRWRDEVGVLRAAAAFERAQPWAHASPSGQRSRFRAPRSAATRPGRIEVARATRAAPPRAAAIAALTLTGSRPCRARACGAS